MSQICKSTHTEIKREKQLLKLKKIIKSLKSKDSHGCDEIATKLLK